jgi:hypothetical protein
MIIGRPMKYSILILITLTIFGFYAMIFDWFIVSNSIYKLLCLFSSVGALIMGVLIYIDTYKKNFSNFMYARLDPKNKLSHKVIAFPVIVSGCQILTFVAVAYGIPASLHLMSNTEASIELVVEYKSSSSKNKHCLDFEGFSLFNGGFCRLPRHIWRAVEEGDHVYIYGSSSFWGFRASNVKLNKSGKHDR